MHFAFNSTLPLENVNQVRLGKILVRPHWAVASWAVIETIVERGALRGPP